MGFRATVVAAAGAAFTAAVWSDTWRQPSRVLCAEMPSFGGAQQLDDVVADTQPSDELTRCMTFLDANRSTWNVESHNVDKLEDNSMRGLATVQVMRLASPYTCSYDGKTAPFLRIVAFLPHVDTETVFQQVTDIEKRRAWDTNYQMFEAAPVEAGAGTQDLLRAASRPWWSVVKYHRQCLDGVCGRFPDSESMLLENRWFAHRLGSSFLSKLGVADRFFAYQRNSIMYRPSPKAKGVAAYDIVYGGAPDLIREASQQSQLLAAFLAEKEAQSSRCKPVLVNYQHILLLPISDIRQQLLGDSASGWKRLSEMASIADEESSKVFHDCLIESNRLALSEQKKPETSGTLFVITSANCADVPAAMPLMVQRRISWLVTSNTYTHLQKACLHGAGASPSVRGSEQ